MFEGVSKHALCGASFYALEIFNWDKDWTMCSSVEGDEEELVLDGINIPQRSLAIASVNDVAIVLLIWGGDLRVGKLKSGFDVHERIRFVIMRLCKQVVVNRMKHLCTIHFVSLVVNIGLRAVSLVKG